MVFGRKGGTREGQSPFTLAAAAAAPEGQLVPSSVLQPWFWGSERQACASSTSCWADKSLGGDWRWILSSASVIQGGEVTEIEVACDFPTDLLPGDGEWQAGEQSAPHMHGVDLACFQLAGYHLHFLN